MLVFPSASHRSTAWVEITHVCSEMRKVILKSKSSGRLLRRRRIFSSEMNCSRSFRHPVPLLHCCLQYATTCHARKQIHENAKAHKYLPSSPQLQRWLSATCPSQSALRGAAFSFFKSVLVGFFRLFEAFRASSVDTACARARDYTRARARGGHLWPQISDMKPSFHRRQFMESRDSWLDRVTVRQTSAASWIFMNGRMEEERRREERSSIPASNLGTEISVILVKGILRLFTPNSLRAVVELQNIITYHKYDTNCPNKSVRIKVYPNTESTQWQNY